jgi:hypothetical protein
MSVRLPPSGDDSQPGPRACGLTCWPLPASTAEDPDYPVSGYIANVLTEQAKRGSLRTLFAIRSHNMAGRRRGTSGLVPKELSADGAHGHRGWSPNLDSIWTPPTHLQHGPVRKYFEGFGGPGEIRTHDLFHAMVEGSITCSAVQRKQKTCGSSFWTPFGLRGDFRANWTPPGLHLDSALAGEF